MLFIILNGKKAGEEEVRSAISVLRKEVKSVEVRVTYEYGDVKRFLKEAIEAKATRVIIGGGDGSVNEMADAMLAFPREQRPELGILPLGTANDFATACNIPLESLEALRFAVSGKSTSIDIAKANEKHFVNMATAGFGAEVTATTPVELKNFLGGGAYTLTGVLKAIDFKPYKAIMKTPEYHNGEQYGLVAAVCNGRQAGGGQVLAPYAFINDGLLDVVIISAFKLIDIPTVIAEIKEPSAKGKFVKYFKTPWIESESEEYLPVNLDGEPYKNTKMRFEVVPQAIDLVLPSNCPCLK